MSVSLRVMTRSSVCLALCDVPNSRTAERLQQLIQMCCVNVVGTVHVNIEETTGQLYTNGRSNTTDSLSKNTC